MNKEERKGARAGDGMTEQWGRHRKTGQPETGSQAERRDVKEEDEQREVEDGWVADEETDEVRRVDRLVTSVKPCHSADPSCE